MKITKTMGSICAKPEPKEIKPPADLAELLQQSEKTGLPTPWLSEFQKHCTDLDTRTKMVWRATLLEFVLETRTILKLSKENAKEQEKQETLKNLILQLEDRFFPAEGGIAISNSELRDKFRTDLENFRGANSSKGIIGVKKVLESDNVTISSISARLQEVYLDPNVWDKLDKLYLQFLKNNPSLPSLAVLLSIL